MVLSNKSTWDRKAYVATQHANFEMFSNPQQKQLEALRISQINSGEGLILTEEDRQALIQERFPFPTRWVHNDYKVNRDPARFNLMQARAALAVDGEIPPNVNLGEANSGTGLFGGGSGGGSGNGDGSSAIPVGGANRVSGNGPAGQTVPPPARNAETRSTGHPLIRLQITSDRGTRVRSVRNLWKGKKN